MKKEKYLQIFNYLHEFSKLRSKPVRDIEGDSQYPEIIWLADIPQCDIFDCVIFDSYNQDADYWVKIAKPKVEPQSPSFPKINELLSEWVVEESLMDDSGIPTLKEKIVKKGSDVLLSDQPEIIPLFQDYINNNWLDDIQVYQKDVEKYNIEYEEFEIKSKIYKRFFSIYNKAQQFGEEFELIVGLGLLFFREDIDTPLICRHIFTSKAEISFEFSQRESFVKVSPSIENEIQMETDAIIDLIEQFDSSNILDAEKIIKSFFTDKNISDNPFDNQIKEAIQIFADRMRTDGQSTDALIRPRTAPTKPTIFYAPALILRKRNTRSFTALYEKIIADIENAPGDFDIPTINDILGIFEQPNLISEDGDESEKNHFSPDDPIYFPKKYNDEQIEIIEKARRNNKVLVQGPPGTGKSHTIANLICHLLAYGKKVLVTAYTKRALEVLHDQLPQDFQNLTVNLLSGDSSSIKDLDASVNAINDELSRITNLNSFRAEIEEKEVKLSILKEDRATTYNEWLKIKEKSTRTQNINKNFQGIVSEIAERIEKEHSIYTWFKDEVISLEQIEFIDDVKRLIQQTQYYSGVDTNVFKLEIPKKEKILSIVDIQEYHKLTYELQQKLLQKERYYAINCKDYFELKNSLQNLLEISKEIENSDLPFKTKILISFKNSRTIWGNKIAQTKKLLTELSLEELKNLDRSVQIEYPTNKSLIELKSDAEFLLNLLHEGKRLTGFLSVFNNPLSSANIKQRKYFINAVQVNGSDCDTVSDFEAVLRDIKIKQDFTELECLWECKLEENVSTLFEKAKYFKKLNDDTERLVNLLIDANKVKDLVESISTLKILSFETNNIHDFIELIDYNELLSQTKNYKGRISLINNYLTYSGIHHIAKDILNALETIDVESYERHYNDLDNLYAKKDQFVSYKKLQEKLTQYFPKLVDDILHGTFKSDNIDQLENAIFFKHATSEIAKLLEENYETKLTLRLSDFDHQEEKLISTIASKKAWLFVLDGLNSDFSLRQHLQAWVLAIKKIGKTGKGKKALKFRKEAQHQMEKCKDSIPCWIMPLYKVAETITPEKGMYDYVIIDEASQLGADAIFLLYISKNIIIVGDDKQTSPEYVGVDANIMTPHINRYLKNIEYANYYGTEFSFFDHAKMFCKGMTVLHEHFRCMPEIIEFCNVNFYAPEGHSLYPLKQYSENRIEPLKSVFCQNGYVEGTYQNITNKIEAEKITEKIWQIVNNDRYKGKTIGVIALQGNAQAKLIETRLIDKVGTEEIKRRKIICGNSASFQGDERDIMFLSLVTATNHPNRRALMQPEDERRFNVAVSRAKEQVWLFHSVQLDDLSNPDDLRYKLLNHFVNYKPKPITTQKVIERTLGSQPDPFESWFEVDVYNDIVTNNYSVIPQYEVARGRYRIDLVTILSNGIKIAIECDGDKYHGTEEFQKDLMRQKVLERCGWQFFRIRGVEYYSNRKKSLIPLWEMLKKNENGTEVSASPISPIQNLSLDLENEQIAIPKLITTKREIQEQNVSSFQQQLFNEDEAEKGTIQKEVPRQVENKLKVSSDLFSFPEFLIFTSLQNVYKVQNYEFSNHTEVLNQISFESGEHPIYMTGTREYTGFLIVGFQNGKIGKISMSSYMTEHNRKKLKNGFNAESSLIFIEHIEKDIDLVALSSINKVVLFNTNKINPVDSRTSKGVQVMKPKDGSHMVKVKRVHHAKLSDPEYYRKDGSLNIVGYYLKQGDEI